MLNCSFVQSFKVASALTASAANAAFNVAVSVNKAIIQRGVKKREKTLSVKNRIFFKDVSHFVKYL